jgi:hypothetical protein
MRFGINLRGDLAKLDDAEIASRYEALISEKETKCRALPVYVRNKVAHLLGGGVLFRRGLFHARIFYKIQALLFEGLGLLDGHILVNPSFFDLYLLDCEIKDVRDEIKRRVRRQKTATATS